MTKVFGQKIQDFNRTPAFYLHWYGRYVFGFSNKLLFNELKNLQSCDLSKLKVEKIWEFGFDLMFY